jgi:hypothetical protein
MATFGESLTPYTTPSTTARQPWRLTSAPALEWNAHRSSKAITTTGFKIDLPALTGEARYFNRCTFWAYISTRYTDYTGAYYWGAQVNDYVSYTGSTSFATLNSGINGGALDSWVYGYALPTAAPSPGTWVPFELCKDYIGAEQDTGVRSIYKDNDWGACQFTLVTGILGWPAIANGVAYGAMTTVKNTYDPDDDKAYFGEEYVGWTNGFAFLRCFLCFDFRPRPPMKQFGRGMWVKTAEGIC